MPTKKVSKNPKEDSQRNADKLKKKLYAPFTLIDYRVQRPTIFLEEGGSKIMSAQQLSSVMIANCKIEFVTPNAVALFYNKGWKECECAKKIYNEIIKSNLSSVARYEVPKDQMHKIYDYLEHIQASIVSIYSAIEALANVAIPNAFTLSKKSNKGVTEIWNKENIERWISTTEKIGKIVPSILQIESPSSQWFWSNYIALKKIRDNIIHQKQSKADPQNIEDSFLNVLLNESVFTKIMAGYALIQYFCDKAPRHLHFPILKDEIPVDVNLVKSFDGTFKFNTEEKEKT